MAAVTYKVLGQVAPPITTEQDLYTVLGATQSIASSITVANRGTTLAYFRVAVCPLGVATANKHYLYYDVPIAGNDTFIATIGLTLGATDKVKVYASGTGGGNLSFHLYGSELT